MSMLAAQTYTYKKHLALGLTALLLATTACTQERAAEVVLNGQNSYSRSGPVTGALNVYSATATAAPVASVSSSADSVSSSPAPVVQASNTAPVSSAGGSGIGVSDLAPPTASSSAAPVADSRTPIVSSNTATVADSRTPAAPAVTGQVATTASGTKLKWTTPAHDASRDAAQTAPAANGHVNPWTGQPHFEQTAKTSQNTIASSEVAELKPAAGKAQPATALVAQSVKPAATSGGYMWPVASKKVINSFGPKGGGRVSDGIDIASSEGEPVWAAADGEIVYIGDELKGYGNMVLIKHIDGKTSCYAHLSRMAVDKYDRVKQGDIIGYVGNSGNVRSAQLHFEIKDGTKPVDPQKYLSSNVASN